MHLVQFDAETWLHPCDIIGVQDVTSHYRGEDNDNSEPIVVVALSQGTVVTVKSPLKVVLMTIEEALEGMDDDAVE